MQYPGQAWWYSGMHRKLTTILLDLPFAWVKQLLIDHAMDSCLMNIEFPPHYVGQTLKFCVWEPSRFGEIMKTIEKS